MDIELTTSAAIEAVDITDAVDEAVPAGIDAGVCTVFVSHTTAGVVVNEAEDGLLDDIEAMLTDVVDDRSYRHDRIDDNAAAHLRSVLLGPSVSVPVSDGTLDLGTWQRILFVECDGPQPRRVTVIATGR